MKKNLLFALILIFSVPAFGQVLVTGVVDGDLPGGLPKAAEFFALSDIPDLSIYGVTSANNGNFQDTVEWNFPAVAMNAGDFFYVATDSASFRDFIGFDADFAVNIGVHTPTQINGNDAILVYEGDANTIVGIVDIFGEQAYTDPQTWFHADGWSYRNSNTGPDGGTFVEGNWTIMAGALDGFTTNAGATNPWPVGTYTNTNTGISDVNAGQFLKILNNPVGNTLTFKVAHDQLDQVSFKIIDLLGNVIQTERNQIQAGDQTFSMDVNTLSRGIYFLSIEQGKDTIVRKWIKQ